MAIIKGAEILDFKKMQGMLRQAGKRKQMVVEMQCEIAQLERQKENLAEYKAVKISGMPNGNGKVDNIGNKVIQMEHMEDMIHEIILNIQGVIAQNENLMLLIFHVLTLDEYAVIKARYLNGYRWNSIAERTMYSRSTCKRLHERAMKKLVVGWENSEKVWEEKKIGNSVLCGRV